MDSSFINLDLFTRRQVNISFFKARARPGLPHGGNKNIECQFDGIKQRSFAAGVFGDQNGQCRMQVQRTFGKTPEITKMQIINSKECVGLNHRICALSNSALRS